MMKGMQTALNLSNEVSIVIYKKGENGSITIFEGNQIIKGYFS